MSDDLKKDITSITNQIDQNRNENEEMLAVSIGYPKSLLHSLNTSLDTEKPITMIAEVEKKNE
ncbi:MAG: hypothetical protein RR413_08910 [Christensenellaceae bacterium]